MIKLQNELRANYIPEKKKRISSFQEIRDLKAFLIKSKLNNYDLNIGIVNLIFLPGCFCSGQICPE